ncbi:bifunctional DNA-formamidopyrimidine glycosylase/DNA-(apurinic or apyrimidinic site) lyase [Rubripirellula lacrimiformis]|nr:bifunctional DNA-formamidopyrimidine glycosylase/DNA-(apurinic or apyrimidinic site) lyase [Rubripirellula lacrimiformis]
MPELPEVETMRRGVLPIVGSRIESVERPPCLRRPILMKPRIDAIDRRLQGKQITDIGRRGKRVMVGIEDGQVIVIEPRMTGLVLLADPPTTDHLRLRVTLSGGPSEQLLFWDRRGLGTVRLLRANEIATVVDARLGVDALQITADQLQTKLRASRRPIKVALLDQSAVAGIGNLYAAEILYLAGVDPRARCDRLTKPQWKRIQQATGEVLELAIQHEGSTLSDGTYRNALNDAGGYQNYHRVYDRAGKPCRRCDSGDIQRIVQGQRSTFFCPVCQRKSGLHPSVHA